VSEPEGLSEEDLVALVEYFEILIQMDQDQNA
jgi:hypothetical protein